MNYKLKLEVFEGPLDLLLYLIKKNDIDITDIPIAEITDQYMEYIKMMELMDLNVVGDFLVMAATLMHIKSKMLLPPDPSAEDEEPEDPRDDLAQRLAEYQKFKEIADTLQDKEQARKDFFARIIDEAAQKELLDDAKEVYFDASLFDLINAFSEALKRVPEDQLHEIIKEQYTVEDKIHTILHLLLEYSSVLLNSLFGKARTKDEVIVTFLAVLELIRLREISVTQKKAFGDIEIIRNRDKIKPPVQDHPEEGFSAETDPNTEPETKQQQS